MKKTVFLIGLAVCAVLAVAQPQTKKNAQALGSSVGQSALSSGSLAPATSINSATQTGSSNVWGNAYTGSADPNQTGKATSGSLFGVGNQARSKSVDSFQGYNNSRDTQADQATYFLDRNPVLKPNLVNDPLFSTANLNPPAEFASSTSKVCRQETVPTSLDGKEEFKCIQSYDPYVITCSTTTKVAVTGTELQCKNTSFRCTPDAHACCTVTLECNTSNSSATITYRDCCPAQYVVNVVDATSLRNGVVVNAGGSNLKCDAAGACVLNMYTYYCHAPGNPIGYYPAVNSFTLGVKNLFTATTESNCGPLEGLAAP